MLYSLFVVVVVQSLGHIQLFVTPWTATCQAPLSSTVSQSLFKFMSIESVILSNYLTLCHPLLLQFFPASGSFPMSWLFTSVQSMGIDKPIMKCTVLYRTVSKSKKLISALSIYPFLYNPWQQVILLLSP